jgi:DNA repair exonuclease SbcCD ATPase subunit
MVSKLTNPLAGILVCAKCGHSLIRHPYNHTEARYQCEYTRPICQKSVKVSHVTAAVIDALETAELPELKAKLENGEGKSVAIQKRLLEKLEAQMEEYKAQEDKQYDLLETGKYTQELFDKRNTALRQKMEDCQKKIYEAKSSMPEEVDYAERIVALEEAIAALKDDSVSVQEQNRILKKIVDKIIVTTYPLPKRTVGIELEVFLRL